MDLNDGGNIRVLRQKIGMSIGELAAAANLSRALLVRIETQNLEVPAVVLESIGAVIAERQGHAWKAGFAAGLAADQKCPYGASTPSGLSWCAGWVKGDSTRRARGPASSGTPEKYSNYDLFGDMGALHDPGGKIKTTLPAGLRGDAEFSACMRYRPLLRRWIGETFPTRYWLLIGMNPSTADAAANDPTVTREWGFTVREGYSGLVKANVGDYRATSPADLKKPGIIPCSDANLPSILSAANRADRVVICCGKVPKVLAVPMAQTIRSLRDIGKDLWCFGINSDGSPKHPLYLPRDTKLVRFEG